MKLTTGQPVGTAVDVDVNPWGHDFVPLDLLRTWGETELRPAVILGRGLEFLWSNDAATEALAQAEDVVVEDGLFRLINTNEMPAFVRVLAGATACTSAWCSPRVGAGALVFRIARLRLGSQFLLGVIFHRSDAPYGPVWADFSRVFGLTATEHRVARKLLDGLQVEGIAVDLNIAPGTARIHVRNLYGKLEVNSREAMFRLLLPFHIA